MALYSLGVTQQSLGIVYDRKDNLLKIINPESLRGFILIYGGSWRLHGASIFLSGASVGLPGASMHSSTYQYNTDLCFCAHTRIVVICPFYPTLPTLPAPSLGVRSVGSAGCFCVPLLYARVGDHGNQENRPHNYAEGIRLYCCYAIREIY